MFCRLKDVRRIATRYDKRADNFLSAVLLAAAGTWWPPIPDPSPLLARQLRA
jgi:transposase